ncbi:MAG: ATP-dependent RecD-like DNA helicase [Desulfovibrio sp.]|nr:ATP-dependent RecD-like DNA helicase [Desulfovibrio sp.]
MKFSRTKHRPKNESAAPQDDSQQASLPLDAAEGTQELAGRIERVTFSNPENGFTVARVRLPGSRHPVTVVGAMLDALPGQEFKFVGRWKEDPRYGPQFLAESAVQALPVEEDGIRLFLGSGVIKGVGPELANRIVNHFKEETLDILDRFPERLLEVDGVGEKKLKMVAEGWAAQRDVREAMLFFQSHGVSAAHALRIFKHYGPAAVAVVQHNPYRLCMEVRGFGFLTADAIARKLNFAKDSDLRVEAGIVYVLGEETGQGHVFSPKDALLERAERMLEVPESLCRKALENLVFEGRLILEDLPEVGEAVYLTSFHTAERRVASRLRTLAAAPRRLRPMDPEDAIQEVEKSLGITLAPRQVEAVEQAGRSKVLVVTGGPGTGKTTIIKAILALYQSMDAEALLAAPTGRAAKRMAEACGQEAMTIHRLLEFSQQTGGFSRGEEDPLDCDLLIIDESSMMDLMLMHHLLKAVPLGATMVLVGDVHQLPSVGPGNVLKDIIGSGAVPVVELDEVFRQARQSDIVLGAHAINQGDMPYMETSRERVSDFYFIEEEDPERCARRIVDLVKNHIPRRFKLDPMEDIQVLAPMHKGSAGVEKLNEMLQLSLNPQEKALVRGGKRFQLHDRIMQLRNNYDLDIYNGDLGRVVAVDPQGPGLLVKFDGREVLLEGADLDDATPAYAISIHKSQGSEYPAVVVPVLTQHYVMLQRNLLYTAVTRGRKLVVLAGSRKALAMAVRNNKTLTRHTWLARRLQG